MAATAAAVPLIESRESPVTRPLLRVLRLRVGILFGSPSGTDR